VILIAGIGGMALNIGSVTLTSIACALILGILVNVQFMVFEKKK
jgi:uracil permease